VWVRCSWWLTSMSKQEVSSVAPTSVHAVVPEIKSQRWSAAEHER
jgi:hypothetical protein